MRKSTNFNDNRVKAIMGRSLPKAMMTTIAFSLLFMWTNAFASQDASAYFERGTEVLEYNRLNDAVSSLTEAIHLKPDFVDAYNNRGLALYEMGRYQEAEEDFRKALLLRPGDQKANNNLGILLYNQERYEEALICLSRALNLCDGSRPYHKDILNTLSVIYTKKGMYKEAKQVRDYALQFAGDNETVQREYGQRIEQNGLTLKFYRHQPSANLK